MTDTPEAAEQPEEESTDKATAAPAGKKTKAPKEEDTNFGLVLYTDGSAQGGNPGYAGWGAHGYIYSHLPPTKGTGNPNQYLTADGYEEKSIWDKKQKVKGTKPVEIKPLFVINGLGSFGTKETNNVAEVAGVSNGLQYALEKGVRKVLIRTDSMYAVQGSTEWLPIWRRNNWYKRDGQPVSNRGLWEKLGDNLQALWDKGVEVDVRWVKSHTTQNDHDYDHGNNQADKNADYAAMYAKQGQVRTEMTSTKAEGFWSKTTEKHPFICQPRLYFSTDFAANKEGEYYLGNHGKDDEQIGKRMADGVHSYVKLTEAEKPIEQLRYLQTVMAGQTNSIIMARLDKLYEPAVIADINDYGAVALRRINKNRLDLEFSDEEPITKEARTHGMAKRTFDALSTIQGVLEFWQSGSMPEGMRSTDITEIFYTKDDKGVMTLKPEFVVGFSSLPINASYGKTSVVSKEDKIDLVLGVDLPDRNALKRLEKFKPTLHVVTWMESDKAYRYATIVQAGADIGIWAGMHSNLRVIL